MPANPSSTLPSGPSRPVRDSNGEWYSGNSGIILDKNGKVKKKRKRSRILLSFLSVLLIVPVLSFLFTTIFIRPALTQGYAKSMNAITTKVVKEVEYLQGISIYSVYKPGIDLPHCKDCSFNEVRLLVDPNVAKNPDILAGVIEEIKPIIGDELAKKNGFDIFFKDVAFTVYIDSNVYMNEASVNQGIDLSETNVLVEGNPGTGNVSQTITFKAEDFDK